MSGQLIGGDKLNRRLEAIKTGRPLLRELQLSAVAEAKALVPRKTGHLARSIGPGAVGATFALVEARTNYAAFVEFGTRPHVIRPRNKRVLAWPAAGQARLSGRVKTGGRVIFAKRVNHPGTKAEPYLVPGAKAALTKGGFRNIIIEQWNKAA